MANRRCISNSVIETDDFLSMTNDGKLVYFMLNMNADDWGFVGNPKAIARQNACRYECLEELEKAGFITRFDSGVVHITHWLLHNTLKNDRIPQTRYKNELNVVYPEEIKTKFMKTQKTQNTNNH